jgi:dihydropyrimidinase
MNRRLGDAGLTAPRYHAISRPALAEEEAINRAVSLAKLVDAPLFVVHVSTPGGAAIVQRERLAGARLFAETCPHYLAFTRNDLDRPGMEGAKYVCSPPLRDRAAQDALWDHVRMGTFDCISSDHAPYRYDETGKFLNGAAPPYSKIANGMPGLAARLPFLFSEGVMTGRMSPSRFAALGASNAARVFGLTRKGRIAPGMDADLAIWNPQATRVMRAADQGDAMDYTPFEGREITGWPEIVIARGDVIVAGGAVTAPPGRGRFVARAPADMTGIPGHGAAELDPARNFGARIAP